MKRRVSRDVAKQKGLTRYFTGKPCLRGHVVERIVSTKACVVCHRLRVHAYPKSNIQIRQKGLERLRIWTKANPELKKESVRRWREINCHRMKLVAKKWCQDNKDRVNTKTHRRRALKAAASGAFVFSEIRDLLIRQQHRCAGPECNANLKVTRKSLDHVIPLSRGGSNGIMNLQWLCVSCNSSKCDRTMDEWRGRAA